MLLKDPSNVRLLDLSSCRLASSGISTLEENELRNIKQSFQNNNSLNNVQLDIFSDRDLSNAVIEGLTGHPILTSITLRGRPRGPFLPIADVDYDLDHVLFHSNELYYMILKTEMLKSITLKYSLPYDIFKSVADASLNANCKSKISDLKFDYFFRQEHPTVDQIYRLLNITTITQLTVWISWDFGNGNARFWDTLTRNSTLKSLQIPTMVSSSIAFDIFLQYLPKINLREIHLRGLYPLDSILNSRILYACRNNFSLVDLRMDGCRRSRDNDTARYSAIMNNIKVFCSRNVVLQQLLQPHDNGEMQSSPVSELQRIHDAYTAVKPVPEALWSTLIYQLKECDEEYKRQMIFKLLVYHRMINMIGSCTPSEQEIEQIKITNRKRKHISSWTISVWRNISCYDICFVCFSIFSLYYVGSIRKQIKH